MNQKIKDKPNVKNIQIGDFKLKFWLKNEIEMDDIYEIDRIDFSLFPNDEFNTI